MQPRPPPTWPVASQSRLSGRAAAGLDGLASGPNLAQQLGHPPRLDLRVDALARAAQGHAQRVVQRERLGPQQRGDLVGLGVGLGLGLGLGLELGLGLRFGFGLGLGLGLGSPMATTML